MMRIVLDLATSWAWTRPPVGIVRAERKFAEFLLGQSGVPVAFCRFDKKLGCHVAIDARTARALVSSTGSGAIASTAVPAIGPAAKGLGLAPGAANAKPARVPLTQRIEIALKHRGLALVDRLPEPLRPDAFNALRAGRELLRGSVRVARGYVRLRRLHRRGSGTHALEITPPAPESPQAFAFAAGDVYFSMGLDWEYANLAQILREKRRVGFRSVHFCYDTIPVRFPHLMSFDARQSFARYFVDVGHVADRVVAISETSRRDFLALMDETGGPRPPVDVVHLGTDLDVPVATIRAPRADLVDRPFVLCVSTIEARKNHEMLYNVWDRLATAHGDRIPTLVIVGMVGWGVGDLMFRMRTNPRVRDHILILDNLADGELAWLYRHCLFTVFPSLYEGWGLPVVESLALGKCCICSTAPAVAEAAQGQAQALDPLDTPAWTAAIEHLWRDDAARDAVAARLQTQFRAQTWHAHGASLIDVARSIGR